ncbi:transmembrane 7 superfamily member 3 [Holotrichia oblita]|uniref:Transmembrane 7 superfamily member 3 n=1 Tax=Holotrichia oblita TaxID=644536 RepID=A0ACB9TAW7_HOLOL|nr:transmembrane 7 superfamily member 3 [Holotrichia oblita]
MQKIRLKEMKQRQKEHKPNKTGQQMEKNLKRKLFIDSSSSESDVEQEKICNDSTDDSITEGNEDPNESLSEGNFVLVKFPTKKNVIFISLDSLNSTNNVYKSYQILEGSAYLKVQDIPFDFGYLLIQVHSLKEPVVLSNTSDFVADTYVNGTNIGLIYITDGENKLEYYLSSKPNANTTILLVIIGHDIKDPIPGGCNLTYDIEIAPFQKVTNLNELIRVDAQAPALHNNEKCPQEGIKIEMYHMYWQEWDFTEGEYFRAIEKMLTVKDVEAHGRRVPNSRGFPLLRRYYASYAGTVSVYSIVTNFRGFRSAYVPAVSFGSDISEVSIYWKILYSFIIFLGLFLCFKGHRFFQVSLFFSGYFVAAMFTYLILAKMDLTDTADIPVFENDINYWSVFIGITLLVTFALLILSHLYSNILTTSFVGAYILIAPFDYITEGNIRYIFLNTVHRATVPNFNLAVIDPLIQTGDQVLLVSWALVTLIGVYVQWKHNRGRAPFPPPPTSPRLVAITEHTPLLGA